MGRVLSLLIGFCASLSGCSAYVAPNVTTDGLLAIKRGMTYEELEALVGPPLCVVAVEDIAFSAEDRRIATNIVGECGPFQRTTTSVPTNLRLAQTLTLSYAEPRESNTDPNIYVSLSSGAVSEVYVKYDDLGICCKEGLPTSPFYWVGSRELLRELVGR